MVLAVLGFAVIAVWSMLQNLPGGGPRWAAPQISQRQVTVVLSPADAVASGVIVMNWDRWDPYDASAGVSLGFPEFRSSDTGSPVSPVVAGPSSAGTPASLFTDPYVRLSVQDSFPASCAGPCELQLTTNGCQARCETSTPFSVQLATGEGSGRDPRPVRVTISLAVSVPAGESLPPGLQIELRLNRPEQAEPTR